MEFGFLRSADNLSRCSFLVRSAHGSVSVLVSRLWNTFCKTRFRIRPLALISTKPPHTDLRVGSGLDGRFGGRGGGFSCIKLIPVLFPFSATFEFASQDLSQFTIILFICLLTFSQFISSSSYEARTDLAHVVFAALSTGRYEVGGC